MKSLEILKQLTEVIAKKEDVDIKDVKFMKEQKEKMEKLNIKINGGNYEK